MNITPEHVLTLLGLIYAAALLMVGYIILDMCLPGALARRSRRRRNARLIRRRLQRLHLDHTHRN